MKLVRLAALLAVCVPAAAQAPYLVKDINTTNSNATNSSSPAEFAAFGQKVAFTATTDGRGSGLWETDGTIAGTSLIASIVPSTTFLSPVNPVALSINVLLFSARDGNHGNELWATDGTAAGTHLLFDINPGPTSSDPLVKTLFRNHVIFSADDGTDGRELWITDGTAAGTHLLKDLNPGSASSFPSRFVTMGNTLYFTAMGGLWKTDGTSGGTTRVTSTAVTVRSIATNGTLLFLQAGTSATGNELWVSDGTDAGTHPLSEIMPGTGSGLDATSDTSFAIAGGRAFFPANDGVFGRELWVSDGTAVGTHIVADIAAGAKGGLGSYLIALGSRVFFTANDGDHGYELWVTDGTQAGTSLFMDMEPGPTGSSPGELVATGDRFFFVEGNDFVVGALVWTSDGTVAGTHPVGSGVRVGAGPGGPYSMAGINGKLYFKGFTALNGGEPWVADGTEAGSHMIANLAPDGPPSSSPFELTAAGKVLFFYATEGTLSPTSNIAEPSLWRTDGTAAGTYKLAEAGQHPPDLQALGPYVTYSVAAPQSNQPQRMISDGTLAGTTTADAFFRRFQGYGLTTLFPFGDTLFARVNDRGTHEDSLWVTTAAAGAPATPVGVQNPSLMFEWGGRYAFYAETTIRNFGLWTTDGTISGTAPIYPSLAGVDEISHMAYAGGLLFFIAGPYNRFASLWKSDGLLSGTAAIKDLPISADSAYDVDIQAAGRKVFFTAPDALWVSDGTPAGTVEVAKAHFADAYPKLANLYRAGDRIVFVQTGSTSGSNELWVSDGTASGTKLLVSLGAVSPNPASIDGVVYFAAGDSLYGVELWSTDGTPEGTKMIADVNPGPASSRPGQFTRVGNTLFFTAYHDVYGQELFALPLSQPQLSIADMHVAEGNGGSSTAHVRVTLAPAAASAVTVNFATSDGSATAGNDYEPESGTLTFLAGETTKTIDITVNGDTKTEGNEVFFVRLSGANGATISRTEAVVMIDDDDAAADVAVAPQFTPAGDLMDAAAVSDNGPGGATNVSVTITSTPHYDRASCTVCAIPQVTVGAAVTTFADYVTPSMQVWLSAIATAREPDPNPANNATTWTVNPRRRVAVTPAFLTPGAIATLTTTAATTATVTSSDPTVIAASPLVTAGNAPATATLTALKAGTAVITVSGTDPLTMFVVAEGTRPKWPGAVVSYPEYTATAFDKPVNVKALATGVAPITAVRATGTLVLTGTSGEIARRPINGADVSIPVYMPALGANSFTLSYSGDANFAPQSFTYSIYGNPGAATLRGQFVPTGEAEKYTLTVSAAGSPVKAPTGTIAIADGSALIAKVQLVPGANGTSSGQATITGASSSATLTLSYSGDAWYSAGTQQLRVATPRERAVRH